MSSFSNELDAVTEERDLIRQEHLQKVEDMKVDTI